MQALLLAAALTAQSPAAPSAACPVDQTIHTASTGALHAEPLSQLPPGFLMRAVLIRVGPCDVIEARVANRWAFKSAGGGSPLKPLDASVSGSGAPGSR